MIFEWIKTDINEKWIWVLVALAIVAAAVIFLARRSKAAKDHVSNKCDEKSEKTIRKERKLAVYCNDKLTVSGYAASIIGTRKDQQDSYAVIPFDEKKNGRGALLGIVCDGMGGLAAGKEASSTGLITFLESFQKAQDPVKDYDACARTAIDRADQKVVGISHRLGERNRAGTTLVSTYVTDDKLYWCSVGDSRIFHYRNGKIRRLTRDHNYMLLLQEQVRKGLITQEEAEADHEKEALISFVGIDGVPLVDTEKKGIDLKSGDIIILCSDGLYKALSEVEIQEIIQRYDDNPALLPGVLTASAMDKWNRHQDNTTVVIISCR